MIYTLKFNIGDEANLFKYPDSQNLCTISRLNSRLALYVSIHYFMILRYLLEAKLNFKKNIDLEET